MTDLPSMEATLSKKYPLVVCGYALEEPHTICILCKEPHLFVLCPDPYCRICRDETGEIRIGWDDAEPGETHAVR